MSSASARSSVFRAGAAALVVSAAAVAVHLAARSGAERAGDVALFLGRFHPLAVHLPIGILLLAALMETAASLAAVRRRLDPATSFVLVALVASSLAGFVLGHLLARDGGYPARLVSLHRSFALAAVIGAASSHVAWTWASRRGDRLSRGVYRLVLGATVATLSIGAHFGGSMTRGDDWLVRFAPASIQRILGEPRPTAAASAPTPVPTDEPLVFRDVVLPILQARCAECHGGTQSKGKLRLDSLDALAAGGEGGPGMVPRDAARSAIVVRMALPPSDDEHMPPDGREGPSLAELDLVRWWIDRGATADLRVRDALPPDGSRAVLAAVAEGALAAKPPPAAAAPPAGSTDALAPTRAAPADATTESPTPAPTPATPAATKGAPVASPLAVADDGLAYRDVVAPILASRCTTCHGAQKQKGKLRLDSFEAIRRGGTSGAVVVAGDPDRSAVVARTRLPLDDDLHMPPPRSPQPTPAELELLAWWIRAGARSDVAVAAMPEGLRRTLVAAPIPAPAATAPSTANDPSATPTAPSAGPDAPATAAAELPAGDVDLHAVVRRVLDRRCVSCHSDGGPAAKLSLETHASILRGGKSGPVIVPGRPAESSLVRRMRLPLDDAKHMPPSDETQPVAAELDALVLWIQRGAREADVLERRSLDAPALAMLHAAFAPTAGSTPIVADATTPPAARPRAAAARSAPAASGCASCAIGSDAPSTIPWVASIAILIAAVARRTTRGPDRAGAR